MTENKNNIPELRFPEFNGEWEKYSLSELSSNGFSNGVFNDPMKVGSGYKIINVKDMYAGDSIDTELLTLVNIDDKEFLKNKVINGDIFFTRSSLVKEGIAHSNVYLGDDDNITFDGHLIRMRPNQSISFSKYLAYLLKTESARKQFIMRGKTTTMTTIGQDDISSTKIVIPTLPEQQKIASFLTAVDDKIQKLTKKKELLEKYKKGIMQKIFSQEIRFKDDDGNDYPAWEEKKLSDICKINQGLQIAISERYTESIPDSYFYITNEFLNQNSVKKYYILNPPKSALCELEDILMTRTGNTGKVVTNVKGAFHNNFFKIDYKSKCNRWFLYYFLISYPTQCLIMRFAGTSTIPDLNHSDFYKILINLPSPQEQQKIADFLTSIDKKIESVTSQIDKTKQFKKGLLQKMFV